MRGLLVGVVCAPTILLTMVRWQCFRTGRCAAGLTKADVINTLPLDKLRKELGRSGGSRLFDDSSL